jgi:hypothetical protein
MPKKVAIFFKLGSLVHTIFYTVRTDSAVLQGILDVVYNIIRTYMYVLSVHVYPDVTVLH